MSDQNYDIGDNEQNVVVDPLGDMSGMCVVEKPKNFKKTFGKLIRYAKSHLLMIFVSILVATGSTALALMAPDKMSDMTDLITEGMASGINLVEVANIGFLLIALYAGNSILGVLQGVIMADVTQKITKRMRRDLSTKINRLPMWYYNTHSIGDIQSRITNDADMVGQSLNNSIGMLEYSLTLLIGAVIMMFVTNWIMALTAITASLLGLLISTIIISKSQKYFEDQQKFLGRINGHVEETYAGHTIVKAYNGENETRNRFIGINDKLKKSTFKAQFLSGLTMPIMTFVDNLGYVAVCVVGALLAVNNMISFGIIVAFILYVRYFTQPLSYLAQAVQALQSAAAASERVFEFLGTEEMSDESNKLAVESKSCGSVEFKNVVFGYEDSDKVVIKDFSLSVKSGQKIAIVGPTGAGKTTLVNLLMRFNETRAGEILIDGVSIASMTRADLRRKFCMVLQDTWLFEGTIKENIIYSMENVGDSQVEAAARAVGLDHYVRTLTHGYDTVLDDKVSLSEGQKQQITIARAIIENAPMLILDEATSNVDTRTEIHIQSAMDKLMDGRTSFVIAHRLSTIKNADIILVLKDGDIIESGAHNELLERGGFYAELYNSQFEVA